MRRNTKKDKAADKGTIEAELEAMMAEYESKVTALAARVRRDIIVPACKRYRLGYMTGNGTWFFSGVRSGRNIIVGDEDEAARLRLTKLVPIFDVLMLQVHGNQCLGYYIENVPDPPECAEADPPAGIGRHWDK
jgi:hypothetical protein